MKFTCNARELNTACNNVMRAVSTKMTVPTIEGILMECGSDTLSLTGYDFEFGINTTLQVCFRENEKCGRKRSYNCVIHL